MGWEEEWDAQNRREAKIIWSATIVIVLLMAGVMWLFFPYDTYERFDERVDIWDAKCPFGHYWTHVYGEGCFLSFEMDSNLAESYTIKYMEDGELKTIILNSQSEYTHVILEDSNESMWMDVYDVMLQSHWGTKQREYKDGNNAIHDRHAYYIHVPDPKLLV